MKTFEFSNNDVDIKGDTFCVCNLSVGSFIIYSNSSWNLFSNSFPTLIATIVRGELYILYSSFDENTHLYSGKFLLTEKNIFQKLFNKEVKFL